MNSILDLVFPVYAVTAYDKYRDRHDYMLCSHVGYRTARLYKAALVDVMFLLGTDRFIIEIVRVRR